MPNKSKKITLACQECKSKNYRVHKTLDDRLSINKFCPKCRQHTMHKEEK